MAITAYGKLPGSLVFKLSGKFCIPAVDLGIGSGYVCVFLRLFLAVFMLLLKLRKLAVRNYGVSTDVPVTGMYRFSNRTG
ncbi:MAG: hypothetical protein NTU51_08405 [Bacteroidetes bacterium]|nr:hypothetical protein [Bacteroidota bacterium]